MPDVTNIKGEDGGIFLSDGQTYTASIAANNMLGMLCITETTLTAITMVGWGTTESELVGPTLPAGTFIPGVISSVTVATGLVAPLAH